MLMRSFLYGVVASAMLFSGCIIKGKVVDQNGLGVAGVTVTLSGGASMTTTTDSNGLYQFGTLANVLAADYYTITPSKSLYSFKPSRIDATIITQSLGGEFGDVPWPVDNIDFVASQGHSVVPWLREGNFWLVSWSEIETHRNWEESWGDYDVGSYSLKLGSPAQIGGMLMYEIILDGDIEKYTPRWQRIGADASGNVYGVQAGSQTPVLLFSQSNSNLQDGGFYKPFESGATIEINANATVIPSSYTQTVDYFDPPLYSVGTSSSFQNIDIGGCEYFPGYGTICTETSSGPYTGEHHLEYWHPNAGPVGMHYAYNYEDCIGTFCNEHHIEQRAIVWFYGDTGSNDFAFHDEPDSYADPTPFPVSGSIFTMLGNVHPNDAVSGYIPGYNASVGMDRAAQMHDWYEFEITPVNQDRLIGFYLSWNDLEGQAINLDFYLYTSPNNPTYGFMFLAKDENDNLTGLNNFDHSRFFEGTFLPGKYLLGVRRTTSSEFSTEYGIIFASEDLIHP